MFLGRACLLHGEEPFGGLLQCDCTWHPDFLCGLQEACSGISPDVPGDCFQTHPEEIRQVSPGFPASSPLPDLLDLVVCEFQWHCWCPVALRWTHYPLLSSSCPIKRFYGRHRPVNARHARVMHYVYAMRTDRRWFSAKYPAAQTKTTGFLRLLRVRLVSSTPFCKRPAARCRHLASEQSSVKPRLARLGACFCRRISFNYLAYTVHETAPCLVPVGRICGNDHKPIHYSSSQPCAAKRAARSLLLCQLPCSRVRARLPPVATTTNNYNNMVPRPFF